MKPGLIFLFFLFLHLEFSGQRINRLNRKGERTGKWITYIDESKKLKSFEGRFRNGKAIGKNYFYNNDGMLERREVIGFRKLKTCFYYPNGKIKMTGKARLENLPDKLHYYFYGKWNFYSDSGALIKYYYYNKGELVKTEYVDKNNTTNDSLITALIKIDQEFTTHNIVLNDSINANLNNTIKYKVFKTDLRYLDSISFFSVAAILDRYGYPSPKIAGDVSGIPFYILSFAPVTLKENYLNELILAADRGYITWSSLAFFIDKLKVAKGEKQVYGTQGKYDKEYNYSMYPVIDPENLNKRRAIVGLESLED